MKKTTLVTIGIMLAGVISSQAEGSFSFLYVAGSGIKIGTPSAAGEGQTGWYTGSDYSVAAYMGPAGTTDPTLLSLVPLSTYSFFGGASSAAGGPTSDGAGLFGSPIGAPLVTPFAPETTAVIQARAWYNGGQYATYEAALAAGKNVGVSGLYQFIPNPITSPLLPDMDSLGMAAFTVGIVPEPSTIALAGLGLASLWAFRRRK
jgi:hypothetical protein